MSTRSMIGKLNADGTVTAVYCHFDGYPEHVGAILKEHYTEESKIDQLLTLGNLSSLAPNIGEKHDFNSSDQTVCNFYGRDRGEDQCEASTFVSVHQYAASAPRAWGVDYIYILRGGAWEVCLRGRDTFAPY